jgi:hypothetical protein
LNVCRIAEKKNEQPDYRRGSLTLVNRVLSTPQRQTGELSLCFNFSVYKRFMIIQPLPCVTLFVETLNESLRTVDPKAELTRIQRAWLVTILMGIVVSDVLCWAAFERRGLNRFTQNQLRWML